MAGAARAGRRGQHMGGVNRDGGCGGGEQAADQSGSWSVDREALCGHVLDTHAPAALVHAQAAGIALERLVAARLAATYAERYGRTTGRYDVARVRAVVRQLQG